MTDPDKLAENMKRKSEKAVHEFLLSQNEIPYTSVNHSMLVNIWLEGYDEGHLVAMEFANDNLK